MEPLTDFCNKYGDEAAEELLTRICEAHWNGVSHKDETLYGVDFQDIFQYNECNHKLTGRILYENEVYSFVIDNGNWGGTEVKEFFKEDYGETEFWQDIEDRKRRRKEIQFRLFEEAKLRREEEERKRKQAIIDEEARKRRAEAERKYRLMMAEREARFLRQQIVRWKIEGF